jgi:hypothetical protein
MPMIRVFAVLAAVMSLTVAGIRFESAGNRAYGDSRSVPTSGGNQGRLRAVDCLHLGHVNCY